MLPAREWSYVPPARAPTASNARDRWRIMLPDGGRLPDCCEARWLTEAVTLPLCGDGPGSRATDKDGVSGSGVAPQAPWDCGQNNGGCVYWPSQLTPFGNRDRFSSAAYPDELQIQENPIFHRGERWTHLHAANADSEHPVFMLFRKGSPMAVRFARSTCAGVIMASRTQWQCGDCLSVHRKGADTVVMAFGGLPENPASALQVPNCAMCLCLAAIIARILAI